MWGFIWGCIPRPWGDRVHASLLLKYFDGTVFKASRELYQSGFSAYKILGRTGRLGIRRQHCNWDPEARKLLLQPLPTALLPPLPLSLTLDQQWQQQQEDGLGLSSTLQGLEVQVHLLGCMEFTSRVVAGREPGKLTFQFFHPCGLSAGAWKKAGMDPVKGCCQTHSWVKSANQLDLTG